MVWPAPLDGTVMAVMVLLAFLTLGVAGCGSGAAGDAGQVSTPMTTASTAATPTTPTASITPAASTAPTASTEPVVWTAPTASSAPMETSGQTSTSAAISDAPQERVTITVVFDNTALQPGTRADWGFSCLVEGLEKTVLFDTGANGELLLANMEALGVSPRDIDVVVLSHEHGDHTGGLAAILGVTAGVSVYYPARFPQRIVRMVEDAGASPVPVEKPTRVAPGLVVTEPSGSPAESGLLITTEEGPVLITGCAHPGVVEMTAAATELAGGPMYAVLGGFHLVSASADKVERTIEGLKALGVERCGPAHCTGESATARIKAAFADKFIPMGVGATITL